MSLELPYNIDAKNPFLLDARSGPWASIAAANEGIPEEIRVQGLVVIVLDSVVGYYYKDGIEDTDLVPMNTDESAIWGQITGTLSNQTDLQTALNALVPKNTTITINSITNDLSASRSWALTTSNIPEGSNLYYTDARVLSYGDTQWVQLDGTYNNPTWLNELSWNKITGTPTTLAGYGITDAYTQTQIDNFFSGATAITGYNKSNWDAAYAAVGTYVLKAGDTMTGSLLMAAPAGIDSILTGGSDVLNIGTANADIINIGWSGATINIQGTLLWQDVTNLSVTDKLIRLNVGGTASSGSSSGFEIEEGGVATGYFATDGTRTGWDFKAPASQQLTLELDLLTSARTIKMPNADGTLLLDSRNITINGSTQSLAADRTFTITTTGTANRITVTGGTGLTPTIDIASTYVGQTSITTLGTITTGVWNGSVISSTYLDLSGETLATVTGRGATTSTAVTFNGGLSSTTGTFSGLLTSTKTGQYFVNNSGGTSSVYGQLISIGAAMIWGIAGNGTSQIISGDAAYSSTVATTNATSLNLGTNNLVRYTIDASGNNTWTGSGTFGGDVSATTGTFSGAITSSNINAILTNSIASTSRKYIELVNTGGQFYAGVGGSSSGSIFTGQSAYSSLIGSANATSFEIGTNAIVRYSIDASGNHNFGSGTATFGGALSVSRNGISRQIYIERTGTAAGGAYLGADANGFFIGDASNSLFVVNPTTGALTGTSATMSGSFIAGADASYSADYSMRRNSSALVFTGGSSGYYFNRAGNVATDLTITSAGKVGLGTTNPLSIFQAGDFTSSNAIIVGAGSSGVASIYFGRGSTGSDYYKGYIDYLHSSDAMVFGINASERVRLTSTGLLIKTTTDNGTDALQVAGSGFFSPTTSGSATASAITITGTNPLQYTGIRVGNSWLAGRTGNQDVYWGANTDLYTATTTGRTSYWGQNNGSTFFYSSASTTAGVAPSFVNFFEIANTGAATFSNLAGSGNRIVYANSSGTLGSMVIGSGLSFDGTTLTATGGSSGTVTGTGTSGYIPLWNSTSDIGNSVMTQSGTTITITNVLNVGSGSGVINVYNTAATQGTFYGFSEFGSSRIGSGKIAIGAVATYQGVLQYDDQSTTNFYIDNTYDHVSANIKFRLRTAGTPVVALTLTGSGAATFSSSVTASSFVQGGYLVASGSTGLLVLTSSDWGASSEIRASVDINGGSFGSYLGFKNPSGKGFTFTVNGSSVASISSTGAITASSFSGAGTGLTGTASSLTAGYANGLNTIVSAVTDGVASSDLYAIIGQANSDGKLRRYNTTAMAAWLGLGTAAYRAANQDLNTTSNVTFNTGVFTNGASKSDDRLKYIIAKGQKAFGEYFNLYEHLQMIKHSWINPEYGKDQYFSYSAQDVQRYLPQAVVVGADGYLAVIKDMVHTVILDEHSREIIALKKRVHELEKQLGIA